MRQQCAAPAAANTRVLLTKARLDLSMNCNQPMQARMRRYATGHMACL
eukprot:CAMPEP_0172867068 /NCGR_PEP_ID=MMETSP1075-20121228/82504_1 /TAXON_ID=2916 /ORGANISM="Ceratium fusus, Strain PA161109" /LENGTH=47 /DNA_ID= /DNA_START= /DNA_END= /DNA_ORIENTATION=